LINIKDALIEKENVVSKGTIKIAFFLIVWSPLVFVTALKPAGRISGFFATFILQNLLPLKTKNR